MIAFLIGVVISVTPNIKKAFSATPSFVDYKFWYIKRDDNNKITEAGVRFFTGSITTLNVQNPFGIVKAVTRYRRSGRVQTYPSSFRNFAIDGNNNIGKIYTPQDFGNISTDDELRLFLNKELKKVADNLLILPIKEQENPIL